ncbi:MAG: ribulose-phosphate 3-epimerase [Candidatus Latescibacteria bacterium]|nr:ribulose-phosphate 3-epimerase [Candidatus Latescibacterota bacterium]
MKIAASILNCDFLRLGEEISRVQKAGIDAIHLDVMDGHFVPNLSFGVPILKAIRPKLTVPVMSHLMVNTPEKIIDKFILDSDGVIFHIEATDKVQECLDMINKANKLAGIALNPDTPVSQIHPYLNNVYEVLIMSVHPGFGGQAFIPESVDKIKKLKEMIRRAESKALIGVDGGVGLNNAENLIQAGADILAVGSSIFKSKDYADTIKKLRGL